MAKQLGTQIKARMDEYSFYHDRVHGYLVRKTGGVTSKAYHTDNRYSAARDASSEFAHVSKAGKLIRKALSDFIDPLKDCTMVNRLNKELIAIKQLDNQNPRGRRKPETMIADPTANKWLRIFQFNEKVNLFDLLESCFYTDAINSVTTVGDITIRPEVFPEGATYAGLTIVKTVIDFEKACFETVSSEMVLIARDKVPCQQREIHFETNHSPLTKGIEIQCLQVIFYEEIAGRLVPLKSKVHAMGIVAITKAVAAETGPFKPLIQKNKERQTLRNTRLTKNHQKRRQLFTPNMYINHFIHLKRISKDSILVPRSRGD